MLQFIHRVNGEVDTEVVFESAGSVEDMIETFLQFYIEADGGGNTPIISVDAGDDSWTAGYSDIYEQSFIEKNNEIIVEINDTSPAEEAYNDGQQSFDMEISIDANPFRRTNHFELYQAWIEGWISASRGEGEAEGPEGTECPEEELTPEEEGYIAADEGLSFRANPYTHDIVRSTQWVAGYMGRFIGL